jgi:glycosyltransferase involved in cell wall biosynthesis
MDVISFVIPTVNNLKYVKNAYASVRKYAGSEHEIIILDDDSNDGTGEWLDSLQDDNLVIWKNTTGKRLGHTITYNIGAELAKNEIFSILHADMFIGPDYVENALKHLKRGVVVAATRIEPPLHPEGKEKIVMDFGLWPETFKENEFVDFVKLRQKYDKDQTTRGIFAPWFMYKEDFLAIGGHDPLFAPFPYEDSDIFQRFVLAGYDLVQSRDSLVYHLTCRGHRWTDDTKLGQHDDFFEKSEAKARVNYIRKWHSWIKNDEYHYPIIPPKFNVELVLPFDVNDLMFLSYLEIWVDKLHILCKNYEEDVAANIALDNYILYNQNDTLINLREKLTIIDSGVLPNADVVVILDKFHIDDVNILQNLNLILHNLLLEGYEPNSEYEIGNLRVIVNKLENKVHELIKCPRKYE